jgi:thiamine-phosphate pyrophosphorylase
MLLYYITDRKGFAGSDGDQRSALLRRIAEAARAGVDLIQLREKDLDPADLELLAREAMHRIGEESGSTKLLINTHIDVALSVGAHGVHLPAKSPSATVIREAWLRQAASSPVIGVSAHSAGEVECASQAGATFAVLAPIFEKVATGASGIGLDMLREACGAVRIPVLALGGIRLGNTRGCLKAGAAGIAGIRLFQEGQIGRTVDALRWLERHMTSGSN